MKLSHKGRDKLNSHQVDKLNLVSDPVFSMSEADLDAWLKDNVKNAEDTRDYLKRLTKVVARLAKEHSKTL